MILLVYARPSPPGAGSEMGSEVCVVPTVPSSHSSSSSCLSSCKATQNAEKGSPLLHALGMLQAPSQDIAPWLKVGWTGITLGRVPTHVLWAAEDTGDGPTSHTQECLVWGDGESRGFIKSLGRRI